MKICTQLAQTHKVVAKQNFSEQNYNKKKTK